MAIKIEVYKSKDLDLQGATIVDGFSSAGVIGSIVANYIVNTLNLDQISTLDSNDFPAVSLVSESQPKYPARIFADEKKKIVVFLSEFTPGNHLIRPIANTILSWAEENKCTRIITAEGVLTKEDVSDKEHRVYGVGNIERAREDLKRLELVQLRTGIITGVSAVLLNEGMRMNFDVICLLAEVNSNPGVPDVRAPAKVIEIIDKLLPTVKIDVEPLYKEAQKIENLIKEEGEPSQMFG
jgi:uncharacterized protein